jgi:hypothetical protein
MEPKTSIPCLQQPGPIPITSHINPIHTLQPNFRMIHLNFILSSTPTSSEWSLSFMISNQIFLRTSNLPVRVTCHARHSLKWTLIIQFCELYKVWSSSLPYILSPSVTSSLLGPNIFLNTLSPNTLDLWLPVTWRTKFLTHTKRKVALRHCNAIIKYLRFQTAHGKTQDSEVHGSNQSTNFICTSFLCGLSVFFLRTWVIEILTEVWDIALQIKEKITSYDPHSFNRSAEQVDSTVTHMTCIRFDFSRSAVCWPVSCRFHQSTISSTFNLWTQNLSELYLISGVKGFNS